MAPTIFSTLSLHDALPISFPNNWPAETFYWDAVAKLTTGGTGKATLTLATEAAFLNGVVAGQGTDRKSTRLNSSHERISYAVFCLKETYGVETLTADSAGS